MMKVPATIFCIFVIVYLFWTDRKNVDGVSGAIWLPFLYMVFAGSREISFWTNYWLGIGAYHGVTEEGNPYERIYHSVMIVGAFIVLRKRKLNWRELFTQNIWVCAYFLFAALSFWWSDYPFVSFKRWIKALGAVSMVLIISTEVRPYQALGVILRRMAFVLLPLSVLFIRYYTDIGRTFHHYTGAAMWTGATGHKNSLGALCLMTGMYFSWNILLRRRQEIEGEKEDTEDEERLHFSIYVIIIPMIAWLLYMANSATSLACLVVALCLFLVARQRVMIENPRGFLFFGISCIVILGAMNLTFDVEEAVIAMLGRRSDLTTRIPMWNTLLTMVRNPIIGYGYDSFWLGERQLFMIREWGMDRQAHNGYLDMYLNSGVVGLSLVFAWMLAGLRKVYDYFIIDYANAILRLCFIVIFALYNWTETSFYGSAPLFLLFLFATIESPKPKDSEAEEE